MPSAQTNKPISPERLRVASSSGPCIEQKIGIVACPKPHESMGSTRDLNRSWIREVVAKNTKSAGGKSESTQQQYLKKMIRLDSRRDELGCLPVAALGSNGRTFYANRAAVIYVATERARLALSNLNKYDNELRRAKIVGDLEKMARAREKKSEQWRLLIIAGNDLAAFPAGSPGGWVAATNAHRAAKREYHSYPEPIQDSLLDRPAAPDVGEWKRAVLDKAITPHYPRKSKRRDALWLNKHVPNWQDKIVEALPDEWKAHAAVAAVTGCRPQEIERVHFSPYGEEGPNGPDGICRDRCLAFEIHGVKTNDGHGQKFRRIYVQDDGGKSFDFLARLAWGGVTAVPEPRSRGQAMRDPGAAFRMAVRSAGKRVFGAAKVQVSPYCFRHAFASDLKASGYAPELIGVFLGHCSTKTQSAYGRANEGVRGKRHVALDGVPQIKKGHPGKHGRRERASAPFREAAYPALQFSHQNAAPVHERNLDNSAPFDTFTRS